MNKTKIPVFMELTFILARVHTRTHILQITLWVNAMKKTKAEESDRRCRGCFSFWEGVLESSHLHRDLRKVRKRTTWAAKRRLIKAKKIAKIIFLRWDGPSLFQV